MANKPSYFDIAYKQLGLVNKAPTPTQTVLTSNNTVPVNDKPVTNNDKPVTNNDKPATNNVNNNNGAGGVYEAYASAIEQQMSILREQQALAERQRKAALDATITANNQAADKSLKEAYIANMLAKRNMPQQMKAMGVSGGLSETTLADIDNTYMNNRFGIEENRNDANLKARLAYDDGVAGDYSQFLAKQYDLQGTLAAKAAAAGDTASSTTGSGLEGYSKNAINNDGKGEFDGYAVMQVNIGNQTYTVPQIINKLVAQGMNDAQIEAFLNAHGIK